MFLNISNSLIKQLYNNHHEVHCHNHNACVSWPCAMCVSNTPTAPAAGPSKRLSRPSCLPPHRKRCHLPCWRSTRRRRSPGRADRPARRTSTDAVQTYRGRYRAERAGARFVCPAAGRVELMSVLRMRPAAAVVGQG